MATSCEVFLVGLISFLNMSNNPDPHLVPPSAILHRADAKATHTGYIAWDPNVVTLDNAGQLPAPQLSPKGKFKYFVLDGEELSFNDDKSSGPTIDAATFGAKIPHITAYGKIKNPKWEKGHVPAKTKKPKSKAVAAWVAFGHGAIRSDWDTSCKFVFANPDDFTDLSIATPATYHRRAIYDYAATTDDLTVDARPLAGSGSKARSFRFRRTSGTGPVQIWIGNSMKIEDDLTSTPPKMTGVLAGHFKYFYSSVRNGGVKYVPLAKCDPDPNKPGGGGATGYCGPDNQP